MRDQNLEINPDYVAVLRKQGRKAAKARALSADLLGETLVVGAGAKVRQILSASATLNFGNTAAQTSADLTINVSGAADSDPVFLGVPNGSMNANSSFFAWVSGAGVVTVRFCNWSAAAIDPASGVYRICVFKF